MLLSVCLPLTLGRDDSFVLCLDCVFAGVYRLVATDACETSTM